MWGWGENVKLLTAGNVYLTLSFPNRFPISRSTKWSPRNLVQGGPEFFTEHFCCHSLVYLLLLIGVVQYLIHLVDKQVCLIVNLMRLILYLLLMFSTVLRKILKVAMMLVYPSVAKQGMTLPQLTHLVAPVEVAADMSSLRSGSPDNQDIRYIIHPPMSLPSLHTVEGAEHDHNRSVGNLSGWIHLYGISANHIHSRLTGKMSHTCRTSWDIGME